MSHLHMSDFPKFNMAAAARHVGFSRYINLAPSHDGGLVFERYIKFG